MLCVILLYDFNERPQKALAGRNLCSAGCEPWDEWAIATSVSAPEGRYVLTCRPSGALWGRKGWSGFPRAHALRYTDFAPLGLFKDVH